MHHIIRVKAVPNAKREHIIETNPGILQISVREPAENNQANQKILDLVADFYNIPRNKLRIISGHHNPTKKIQLLD